MKQFTAIVSNDRKVKPFRFNLLRFLQVKDSYLVGSMMLLGLLLRLPSLKLGLWRDEASTYFDALPSNLGELITTVIRCELNPPGFYLIMHQWMQWFGGTQEVILKLPTLGFGLLLIPATYGLGRVVGSRATGLVAAAFATLAPSAIYYSQEARPYALAALLCCLSVLLYCQALTSRRQTHYLIGFVLCTSLLFYVQYTGLLLVGSLVVVTLYLLWRREPSVRVVPFALAFIAVFLLFVPWLPIFLTHLHTGTSGGLSNVPWWNLPNQVLENLGRTVPLVRPLRKPLSLLVLLALGVMLGQIIYRVRQPQGLPRIAPTSPMVILAGSVGLLAMMESVLFYGFPEDRYMFPFAPIAWVLYSNWAITLWQYLNRRWNRGNRPRIHSNLRTACVSILLCGLVLLHVGAALSKTHLAKSGIRPLIADVRRMHLHDTFYIVAPDHLGPTFGYYSASMQSVPFYGFPRWEHPELYSETDYAQRWQAPTAITDAEQRIRDQAQRGYHRLAFIQQPGMKDANAIHYSRTDQLLTKLKQTYPLLLTIDYPGASEPVTLYLFNLTPGLKR